MLHGDLNEAARIRDSAISRIQTKPGRFHKRLFVGRSDYLANNGLARLKQPSIIYHSSCSAVYYLFHVQYADSTVTHTASSMTRPVGVALQLWPQTRVNVSLKFYRRVCFTSAAVPLCFLYNA